MAAWDRGPVIRRELRDGERVVWSGVPGRGAMLLRAVLPIVFGAGFTAMPLSLLGYVWSDPAVGEGRFFITVFMSIFLLVGAGLAAAGIAGVFSSARTAFAVTDRRVLIIRDRFGRKVVAYEPREIGSVARKERADGSGHVEFLREARRSGDDRRLGTVGFYGVAEVRAAAAALERLRPPESR